MHLTIAKDILRRLLKLFNIWNDLKNEVKEVSLSQQKRSKTVDSKLQIVLYKQSLLGDSDCVAWMALFENGSILMESFKSVERSSLEPS